MARLGDLCPGTPAAAWIRDARWCGAREAFVGSRTPGSRSEPLRVEERVAVQRILLVCRGNTCRSPMAAALLRQRAARHAALQHVTVDSAGLAAPTGEAASPDAVQVMGRRGIALGAHRARQVDAALVEHADLILTMTPEHVSRLCERFPNAAGKAVTLGDYAGKSEAIPDPIGGGLPAHERCAEQLDSLIAPRRRVRRAAHRSKEHTG